MRNPNHFSNRRTSNRRTIVGWILLIFLLCILSTVSSAQAANSAESPDIQQAANIPWSGYWWPYHEGGLATGIGYRGNPSPLEKYERLVGGRDNGPSVLWYKRELYDPEAPGWWGHCGDWARAACLEDFEILPSSEDNIIFRVGDKKGLLTLAHDNDLMEWGEGHKPEVFHFWLLSYIKEQKKPFVADLEGEVEIWNFPIYRYEMETVLKEDRESVTVTVWYPTDMVHPDYIGSLIRSRIYTYDLLLNEQGEIVGGEWTGNSIDEHPQRMLFPLEQRSTCPYLDYPTVLEIAKSKDDFLESTEGKKTVAPGTYNLVLLNEDRFRLAGSAGDLLSLKLQNLDGSDQAITAVLMDRDGLEVASVIVEELENYRELSIIMENPPYEILLSQEDYEDPGLYRLHVDLRKPFVRKIPYVPKNGMWSGFTVTNADDTETGEVLLYGVGADGLTVQTLRGPVRISAFGKELFLFEELPWRIHELAQIDSLYLVSDSPVHLLNLYGMSTGTTSCFARKTDPFGDRLILPETVSSFSSTLLSSGVANEGTGEISLMIDSYTKDGLPSTQHEVVLGSRESYAIKPGTSPFHTMPDDGWIEVSAGGGDILSAFQFMRKGDDGESLYGLRAGRRKIIPHITPPIGIWTTDLTLINPNETENTIVLQLSGETESRNQMAVTLLPREKRTISVGESLGRWSGEAGFRKIMILEGEFPLAGYYSYKMSANTDTVRLPLLEEGDLGNELVLPHYAGPSPWWTGIGLFNGGAGSVEVRVAPYDRARNLMAEAVRVIPLDPGAYDVMTVADLVNQPERISFIKFAVESGSGPIGGFYLYGNQNGRMLSGGNL